MRARASRSRDLAGPFGYAQGLCDLPVGVPVEVGQLQRPPLRLGQVGERLAHLAADVGPDHGLRHVRHAVVRGDLGLPAAAPPPGG